MSKFIIGKKLEMTQKFRDDGKVIPVTKVIAGPCFVTQVKTEDKDGYQAIQLGFDTRRKITNSVRGHLKNLGPFRYLKEFKIVNGTELKAGQQIKASIFKTDDIVNVTGVSKGKGFQGVVRRWGFSGGPASHGHKDQLRMPGSIGATGERKVVKGKKMPGRMGANRVTVKNLKIIEVDDKNNLLYVKGAIPGRRKSLVLITGTGEVEVEKKVEEKITESKKEKTEELKSSEV